MAHERRNSTKWRKRGGILAAFGVAVAGASLSASAVMGPSLGAARSFAVLGASEVSSTGLTVVTGDVGVSPGTGISGFGPGIVIGGALHAGDEAAAAAHADASLAYAILEGMASIPADNLSDQDLGGMTLAPAVYKFNTSAGLTGNLVLDAGGDPGAVFVFQIGSTLTTASNSTVTVINGGKDYDESNVYWQVGSSATLGSGTAFTGNILAYASITLVTGTSMKGNALALNGAVTLDANAVTGCAAQTNPRPTAGRTKMTPPENALDTNAVARINVKHFPAKRSRPERSWLRIKVRHLDKTTSYTLWADDPSTPGTELVQFDVFVTKRNGNFNYTKDTKKFGVMPFGATLAALSGRAVEVRDAAGTTTLLEGTIPTTSP